MARNTSRRYSNRRKAAQTPSEANDRPQRRSVHQEFIQNAIAGNNQTPEGSSNSNDIQDPNEKIRANARLILNSSKKSINTSYQPCWERFKTYCDQEDYPNPEREVHADSHTNIVGFMLKKCVFEGKKHQTAELIHASAKHFYSQFHPNTVNPADHHMVTDTLKSIKRLVKQSGSPVKRAKPVQIEELLSLHSYLFVDSNNVPRDAKAYIWAAAVIAFHCFLRIDELFSLQYGDLLKNQMDRRSIHHILRVKFRKTAQEDHDGQKFEIHDEGGVNVALKCKEALDNWLLFLEKFHEINESNKEEFENVPIFPKLDFQDYSIHPGENNNGERFRKAICELFVKAGVDDTRNSSRTMHTFRRGGLQYRFVKAPKRWNLISCQKWGGWSPTEHQAMINYLLNEIHDEEDSYYTKLLNPNLEENHIIPGDEEKLTVSMLRRELNTFQDTISLIQARSNQSSGNQIASSSQEHGKIELNRQFMLKLHSLTFNKSS